MRSLIVLGIVLAVFVVGIAGLAVLLGSLGSEGEAEDETEREPLTLVTAEGGVAYLEVEVADTPDERAVGLSGRDEVPEDTGMLFVFQEPSVGFWMKDTTVPLSVAFLDSCGEIIDIQQMEPLDLTLHHPGEDFSFGLEVSRGWFAENGFEAGDLVSIPRDYRNEGC